MLDDLIGEGNNVCNPTEMLTSLRQAYWLPA